MKAEIANSPMAATTIQVMAHLASAVPEANSLMHPEVSSGPCYLYRSSMASKVTEFAFLDQWSDENPQKHVPLDGVPGTTDSDIES